MSQKAPLQKKPCDPSTTIRQLSVLFSPAFSQVEMWSAV